MKRKNYDRKENLERTQNGKYEIKGRALGTLFFNNVLLCREDTKMYQVIF